MLGCTARASQLNRIRVVGWLEIGVLAEFQAAFEHTRMIARVPNRWSSPACGLHQAQHSPSQNPGSRRAVSLNTSASGNACQSEYPVGRKSQHEQTAGGTGTSYRVLPSCSGRKKTLAPPQQLVPVGFSLVAALCWGTSDFSGGYASKRSDAFLVTISGPRIGICPNAHVGAAHPCIPPFRFKPPLGSGGGCFGAGPPWLSSIAPWLAEAWGSPAPVAAVLGAGRPNRFRYDYPRCAGQNRPSRGFVLAGLGIWLISRPDGSTNYAGILTAALSGIGFAGFFICIDRAGDGSALWSAAHARLASLAVVSTIILFRGRPGQVVEAGRGHRNVCWVSGRKRHRSFHSSGTDRASGFGRGAKFALPRHHRSAGSHGPSRTIQPLENDWHLRRSHGRAPDRPTIRRLRRRRERRRSLRRLPRTLDRTPFDETSCQTCEVSGVAARHWVAMLPTHEMLLRPVALATAPP